MITHLLDEPKIQMFVTQCYIVQPGPIADSRQFVLKHEFHNSHLRTMKLEIIVSSIETQCHADFTKKKNH